MTPDELMDVPFCPLPQDRVHRSTTDAAGVVTHRVFAPIVTRRMAERAVTQTLDGRPIGWSIDSTYKVSSPPLSHTHTHAHAHQDTN